MINKVSGLLCMLFLTITITKLNGANENNEILLKVFHYQEQFKESMPDSIITNAYMKYTINIAKKNALLMTVPTMYRPYRMKERKFFTENYSNIIYYNRDNVKVKRQIKVTTNTRGNDLFDYMLKFLGPDIYEPTIVENILLSPFNKHNRRFYIYHNIANDSITTTIRFRPKVKNTQLVRGDAVIENATGRIVLYQIRGEYDMVRFNLYAIMGKEGYKSLFPIECNVNARLSYIGNKVLSNFHAIYELDKTLPDSIVDSKDRSILRQVRPIPLSKREKEIVDEYREKRKTEQLLEIHDTAKVQEESEKRNMVKYIFWDVIGDNLLNKITADFGEDQKGHLRIGPIFNPLYFGYNEKQKLVYKFDTRLTYAISANSDLYVRLRMGYSFKLDQFYIKTPFRWNFNKRKNGYIEAYFSNGDRIYNSTILDHVKETHPKRIDDLDNMKLDYFRELELKTFVNYDLTEKFGLQLGYVYRRRSAISPQHFKEVDKPTSYNTFSPMMQLQYRPASYKGVILTADFENGLRKIFSSDAKYFRCEIDASYIHQMSCMRSLSMRVGSGFYVLKGDNQYFLDYSNFCENNILTGWNDDWTGEFELLNSTWYNASDYYFRTNITYESPLLILSRMPIVGHFTEKERIYLSGLHVRSLHPYIECGYGFTNRLFSMGVFMGFSQQHFEGFGFKFGFELFNNW